MTAWTLQDHHVERDGKTVDNSKPVHHHAERVADQDEASQWRSRMRSAVWGVVGG